MDVWVEREGDEYRLVTDELIMKKIGSYMRGFRPTPGDIKLLARNPIKAPQLLMIRDKATAVSKAAHLKDKRVPKDAYRHVLWAYLLTREYGAAFARQAGIAHESAADSQEEETGKSEMRKAYIYQDLNNDAVGQRYALTGYPEDSILERLLTDTAVIRDDEMMDRYTRSLVDSSALSAQ